MKTVINHEVIVTIVKRGYGDYVVSAAKEQGATGATIISGRGTSPSKEKQILGISISPEKDVVLILVDKSMRKKVMQAIVKATNLNEESTGISFSLPVTNAEGLTQLVTKVNEGETTKSYVKPKARRK